MGKVIKFPSERVRRTERRSFSFEQGLGKFLVVLVLLVAVAALFDLSGPL